MYIRPLFLRLSPPPSSPPHRLALPCLRLRPAHRSPSPSPSPSPRTCTHQPPHASSLSLSFSPSSFFLSPLRLLLLLLPLSLLLVHLSSPLRRSLFRDNPTALTALLFVLLSLSLSSLVTRCSSSLYASLCARRVFLMFLSTSARSSLKLCTYVFPGGRASASVCVRACIPLFPRRHRAQSLLIRRIRRIRISKERFRNRERERERERWSNCFPSIRFAKIVCISSFFPGRAVSSLFKRSRYSIRRPFVRIRNDK